MTVRMGGVVLAAAVLLATTAGAQERKSKVRIAAPGFTAHGLSESAGDFYSDQVSQQLTFHGLAVLTRSEVSAVLGNERQKELLGCHDESGSCAVELAGALGTDGLLLGEAAKVGDQFRLSIRIVSSTNGDKISSAVVTGTSEDAVLDAFRVVAPRVAQETIARVGGSKEHMALVSERTGTKRFFWIPAALGAVSLGAGAFGYVQAKNRYDELRSAPSLTEPRPSQLRNEGQSWQTISLVTMGAGVALLGVSAGLFTLGSDATVEAGVVLAPGGGSISIAGVLP